MDTNDYLNKDSNKGGVSVYAYRHRADLSYTSLINSKPKGKVDHGKGKMEKIVQV